MLSFGTDGWTSPNHKAFIAFTVHFEEDGEPKTFLLDLLDVMESHSGDNMACTFERVLEDFGIEDKVSRYS